MSLGRVAQRNQPDGSLTSTGNRCSRWQLIKSLKTKTRRYAEVLLRYYIDGKHSLDRTPTVQQFYEKWIERKIEPLVRRNQIRDYRQAFGTYTCRCKDKSLPEIGTGDLQGFQVELLKTGLAVKTCRNIVDRSFCARYRDAKAEIAELAGRDPFIGRRLAQGTARTPDPFSAAERDQILAYFAENEPFIFRSCPCSFRPGADPRNQPRAHMGGLAPGKPYHTN